MKRQAFIDKNLSGPQIASMNLLTFAHLGEANAFIEKFQLKRIEADLYQNDNLVVVITGEGPFEAATKTALTIPRFPIKQIINPGIAGSLDEKLNLGEVYPTRSIYLIKGSKPEFKTFQASTLGLDCLTSFERILDRSSALRLRGIGKLIDREAWGVAMAAKTAGLPFTSFKVISDFPGSGEICEFVKESAEEFSFKLLTFYAENFETALITKKQSFVTPGLHFTFSMKNELIKIINKLAIRDESTSEGVFSNINLTFYQELEVSPKEKAKRLLHDLEQQIDPVNSEIRRKMDHFSAQFESRGLKLSIDPQWENASARISFDVKNNEELNQKITELQKISIKPFTDIMEGKLDVE